MVKRAVPPEADAETPAWLHRGHEHKDVHSSGEKSWQENPAKNSHHRPRQCLSITVTRGRVTTLLAGIRAGGCDLHRLPKRLLKHSVAVMKAESWRFVHLPLRGQRRLGWLLSAWPSCFPLNCAVWTTPRAPTDWF